MAANEMAKNKLHSQQSIPLNITNCARLKFISIGYDLIEIIQSQNYDMNRFACDLRKLFKRTAIENKQTVLLFHTDDNEVNKMTITKAHPLKMELFWSLELVVPARNRNIFYLNWPMIT